MDHAPLVKACTDWAEEVDLKQRLVEIQSQVAKHAQQLDEHRRARCAAPYSPEDVAEAA